MPTCATKIAHTVVVWQDCAGERLERLEAAVVGAGKGVRQRAANEIARLYASWRNWLLALAANS
jgi:hypothetical protein